MSDIRPFPRPQRRFTDHYHLMTPALAVDKYGISLKRAQQLFQQYGFRNGKRGRMFMHPDRLEQALHEPWKLDENPHQRRYCR